MPGVGEGGGQIVERDRVGHRDDVAAGHRHLARGAVAEVQQVAQHLAFVGGQVAADRALALGIVDRFLDLVAKRGLAIVAEDQRAHPAPQPRSIVGGGRHQSCASSR